MPRKFREESLRGQGPNLNWAMCALCVASLAVSGVLYYRELGLELRISNLEERCVQRMIPAGSPAQVVHYGSERSEIIRMKRDVSECNCPPG